MDNLDRDVAMAMKLGYGVHYGDYKTNHPNTREKEPEQILDPNEYGICRNCGKMFPKRGRGYRKLYCDDVCRMKYSYKVTRERTLERQRRNE